MSTPKKPTRGTRSEPARRATDGRAVRSRGGDPSGPTRKAERARANATTEVFARQLDSARVHKGESDAVPATVDVDGKVRTKPTAKREREDASARATAQAEAVPKRASSLESAPIGLRKASIAESGGAIVNAHVVASHESAPAAAPRRVSPGHESAPPPKSDTR